MGENYESRGLGAYSGDYNYVKKLQERIIELGQENQKLKKELLLYHCLDGYLEAHGFKMPLTKAYQTMGDYDTYGIKTLSDYYEQKTFNP